jgi:hypothetical protein
LHGRGAAVRSWGRTAQESARRAQLRAKPVAVGDVRGLYRLELAQQQLLVTRIEAAQLKPFNHGTLTRNELLALGNLLLGLRQMRQQLRSVH